MPALAGSSGGAPGRPVPDGALPGYKRAVVSTVGDGSKEAGGASFVPPLAAPFVGRDREREEILRALDHAEKGRGRLVLLVGEPGIGKTRLADEVTAAAGARGVPVLWGRCWEAGGAPSFWPWLDVIAALAALVDDRTLRQAVGDGGALVAELLPSLGARLGSPAPVATPSPDVARFRLFQAVTALARAGAAGAAVVLVLDDLHAADESSLLLLHFLARELRTMRVLVVGTMRDVEARLTPSVAELLARIGREGTTLPLSRLDREATATFLRQRARQVPPDVEARVFQSTQGNPLFIEEMARLLETEGAPSVLGGALPDGVRDVIRQRLDRVAETERALLELAAVAGDDCDRPLLAAASGHSADEVAGALAAAVRAGVLAERGTRPRFAHALVREVLYRDLAVADRRRLHGQVFRALERLRRAEAAHELAHHALEGPPELLPPAVAFAMIAASQALARVAYDDAIVTLSRAVAAIEAAGNPPALRAPALLALAEARIRCGEPAAGQTLCREVASLARALPDSELLARAAHIYGLVFTFAVVDPILIGLLEEALEALPPGDSAPRARALARLAAALQPAQDMGEPVRIAREAIAMARRLGDPATLREVIFAAVSALMDVVHPAERLALNLEVEQLAAAAGDRERLVRTHGRLVVDYTELGDLAAADARIDLLEALARELRAPWYEWRAPLFRSMRATMNGHFAEAERHSEAALRLGREGRDPQVERCMVLHRESLLRAAERHDDMLAHDALARREKAVFMRAPSWQAPGTALVHARREEADRVRLHLGLVPADMHPVFENPFALFFYAEPTAFAGEEQHARKVLALLELVADRNVMLGLTQVAWEGPVTRLLGLLHARLAEWDRAFTRFEEATGVCRALDAGPYLARTLYEHARARLQRGEPGDVQVASALLTEAHQRATALGLADLVRLIDRRRPNTSAAPVTAPAASSAPFAMIAEGEYWAFTYEGATFRLKDGLGIRYLARLVAEPDRELHVLELAGAKGEAGDAGDAGELLDEDARQSYRARLEDLRETLAEAESFGDASRAAKAREEMEFLAAELGRAVGLGGRSRRAGGAAERARSAVQRRIKSTLERIRECCPSLADYLGRTVRTGNYCVFRPGAR